MLISDLAILLKANISIITALNMLSKQYPIAVTIKQDIMDGASLSDALKKFPRDFDHLTIHLIKAGEKAAALPLLLESIAAYHEKIKQLKMRIKKAVFYPSTVLILALIITIGLLLFIVPQFENLFETMGAELPWFTQMILVLSTIIQHHFLILFLFFILLFSALFYFRFSLPIIGKVYQKIILSRFSYTLSLLLSSGIVLTEALKISANIVIRKNLEKAVLSTRESIIKGKTLFHALEETRQFPILFLQFIHIGEQSGSLKLMLNKISEVYESETDHMLNLITLLLEPAIMTILGILIGGLVIAMYMPVFQLGKIV